MKKLTFLLVVFLVFNACGGNKKTSANQNTSKAVAQAEAKTNTIIKSTQDPIQQAILISDFETFMNLAGNMDSAKLDWYLTYAAGICDPYRRPKFGDAVNVKPVCQKENNAKIIQVLANLGAQSKTIRFFIDEGYTLFQANTIVSDLKAWNPMAVRYVVNKLDKCLVALTQMQEADVSKPNYYVYADVWRDNNCSVNNYQTTYGMSTEEEKKLYFLIGTDKAAVQKEFGTNPTVYDRPSEYREILTYKQAKERQSGVNFYVEEYHYIFTIDRGVVTKIQKMHISSTDGKGQTEVLDQEKLKEHQKNVQEHFAGKPMGKRERAIRKTIR